MSNFQKYSSLEILKSVDDLQAAQTVKMSLIIKVSLLISVFFILIQSFALAQGNEAKQTTLKNFIDGELNDLIRSSESNPLINMLKSVKSFRCVEETLRLSDFGEKSLNGDFAKFLTLAGYFKCNGKVPRKTFLNFVFEKLAHTNRNLNSKCSKILLKSLDPQSALIKNFNDALSEENIKRCEILVPNIFEEMVDGFENHYLETCHQHLILSSRKYLYRSALLGREEKSAKNIELYRIFSLLDTEVFEVFDCIINSLK